MQSAKHHGGDDPERYMELAFLYKTSIGQGAVQQTRHLFGDSLQKMDIVFWLIVPAQVWRRSWRYGIVLLATYVLVL